MKFIKTKLDSVYLIEPSPYYDNRGLFRRQFCQDEFANRGLMSEIKQTNISENKKKHTLRGFHFQYPPSGENKVISCIKGSIYNIVLDLREKSKTYLKWKSFKLSKENRVSLHVPIGCANAYITLEDDSWILYHHSEFYSKGNEGNVRYNDPFFKFHWPFEPKVISKKDLNILDWPNN
tara:strand:+ start:213 stop:746 length:534 start_codon:yes stop_codon:yes gene_type:complete